MAGLRHALDNEVPKARDVHLDSARDAETPRSFGGVVDLRQRFLQQRIIDVEDPSLDREALHVHGFGTLLDASSTCQPKGPLSRQPFVTASLAVRPMLVERQTEAARSWRAPRSRRRRQTKTSPRHKAATRRGRAAWKGSSTFAAGCSVQINSSTSRAIVGRERGNNPRTALRSLIPSTRPTCSSSAPRS